MQITINEEAGSKLISLLKTCLNSLSLCIEMLSHETSPSAAEAAANLNSGNKATAGASSGIAKNATDINAVLFSTFASSANANPAASQSLSSSSSTFVDSKSIGAAAAGQQGLANNSPVLKLIEETLYYLTKVINYAPVESIACLRQLLKYLFARNYGNRQNIRKKCNYPAFTKAYFRAKSKGSDCIIKEDTCPSVQATNLASSCSASPVAAVKAAAAATALGSANVTKQTAATTMVTSTGQSSSKRTSVVDVLIAGGYDDGVAACTTMTKTSIGQQDDCLLLAELYSSGLEFNTWKSENEQELSKHIKLFEPLVIYCLTVSVSLSQCNVSVILNLGLQWVLANANC